MSVYSGFATRNQEQLYDNLVGNVLAALSLRIIKLYRREIVDEHKFRTVIEHQCRYLKKLEKRKVAHLLIQFMEPKYADILEDLLHRTEAADEVYTEMYA